MQSLPNTPQHYGTHLPSIKAECTQCTLKPPVQRKVGTSHQLRRGTLLGLNSVESKLDASDKLRLSAGMALPKTPNVSLTLSIDATKSGHITPSVQVVEFSRGDSSCSSIISTDYLAMSQTDLEKAQPQSNISSITSLAVQPDPNVARRMSLTLQKRLHSIAINMSRRTSKAMEEIIQPSTPDTASLVSSTVDGNNEVDRASIRAYVADIYPTKPNTEGVPSVIHSSSIKRLLFWFSNVSFELQGTPYVTWLALTVVAFLYNAFAIPMRASFPYQTQENVVYWFLVDYLCDCVYLIDLVFVKPHLQFRSNGLTIINPVDMRKHYLSSWNFKLDLTAILPLDIFYAVPEVNLSPLVRLPRLLKFRGYFDLFYIIDNKVSNPYGLRMCQTFGYMFYVIHLMSCAYYSLSTSLGIGHTQMLYDGKFNEYLQCFYFTMKLATSIGNNPSPTNVIEYIFMFVCWMVGFFVFAILLGQIQDVVTTANRNKETFRQTMDATLNYCKKLNLPDPITEKVRMWFVFTWNEQKSLNEMMLLDKLPIKMQTDLAISVHYQILSKVKLFQDCDRALLRALVLKLKPTLFLPGDYVCRKNEIGKEMYIVNKGTVQVMGGPNDDEVLVSLHEGSVFGEISLLIMTGGNRRNADVRAKGFAMLFLLNKNDLHDTIKDYPEAQKLLQRKARRMMKESEARNKKNAPLANPTVTTEVEEESKQAKVDAGTHLNDSSLTSTMKTNEKESAQTMPTVVGD